MTSNSTTRCTQWAAGFEGLSVVAGDTVDEVVSEALADLAERLSGGDMDPDAVEGEAITLYADVTWCTGPDDEHGDCDCGQSHEDVDGAWLMTSHERRCKLPVQVVRPVDEDGDFDVVLAAEVVL